PIKILMPYNPNVAGWGEECQVVQQQMEALLGNDFIEIIIETGPSTGFLAEVRRAGKYALLKCNWGPDYSDPQTFIDPLAEGNNYNFMDKGLEGGIVPAYYAMVADAVAITDDLEARYTAFADAEAYLIDHAVIIPFGFGSGGYIAGRFDPFERQYASSGISNYRYKGLTVLDAPMNTDQYFDSFDNWIVERASLMDD
ncbi:MAG: peptide ABC transporter substrate-binding protein, partial [Clostridia bacterium]|nr:peptide ABC transporter substrate-binding protein [Clostridia bacterium]